MERLTPQQAAFMLSEVESIEAIPVRVCCMLGIALPDLARLTVVEVVNLLAEQIEAATVYESLRPRLSVIEGGRP